MILSNEIITKLRLSVMDRLSNKRYIHTLGVEEMAKQLGDIILPEKLNELRVAALLHDIAKEIPYDKQIFLLESSDSIYTQEDIDTILALHSISAVPLIQKNYSEYATPDVLSAVANHTLGNDNMSVFDEIIFISDYAEAGRTYPSCLEVRKYLLDNISIEKSYEDNLYVLHKAVLMSINSTIDSLSKRGEKIHSKTYLTKSHFEELIRK